MNTIEAEFRSRIIHPPQPDMQPHMAELRGLATGLKRVVEFGLRDGNSTLAFLAAGVEEVVSYDSDAEAIARFSKHHFKGWRGEVLNTRNIQPETIVADLVFIDTLHDFEQVRHELSTIAHADFIALHDVKLCGWKDETQGGIGIMPAILWFLAQYPNWRVKDYWESEWGMLILERT